MSNPLAVRAAIELTWRQLAEKLLPEAGKNPDRDEVALKVWELTGLSTRDFRALKWKGQSDMMRKAIATKNDASASTHAKTSHGVTVPSVQEDNLDKFQFFKRSDGFFEVKAFGEEGIVKATKGMFVIQKLLSAKSGRVSMMILDEMDQHQGAMADSRSIQFAMDRQASKAVKLEYQKAMADLNEAKESKDPLVLKECETKVSELHGYLTSSTGLAWKSRDINNPISKRYRRIHGTLGTAYDKLKESGLKKASKHLELAITPESSEYVYQPSGLELDWKTEEPQKSDQI